MVDVVPHDKQTVRLLIMCPRCGLGNRLRTMVSAVYLANTYRLQLAHLWFKDAPLSSKYLYPDEVLGTSQCDFETLFEPIPFFPPFSNQGQRMRLLTEHENLGLNKGLNIVDEVQTQKLPDDEHWKGVDAVAVLTSLGFHINPKQKIHFYQKYFQPRAEFTETINACAEISKGKWLCLHLREKVRQGSGFEAWNMDEVANVISATLEENHFDRIIVFSDSEDAKTEFMKYRFRHTPVYSIKWETEDYIQNMFLDFLAMSRASLILNSGISSFPAEAALFGGGVPHRDLLYESL